MILSFIVSFFTGITASLGLGGGFILLVYLSAFMGVNQLQAQGINLVFFIPIATISLIFHAKNKLIVKEAIIPSIIFGIIGSVVGVMLAQFLGDEILRKIFAMFILFIGIKEFFYKNVWYFFSFLL